MTLTIDISTIFKDVIGKEGVERDAFESLTRVIDSYNRELWNRPYPFMELPFTRFEFSEMEELSTQIKSKGIKNLVLLGIGGSSLGTDAIFNALLKPLHNYTETSRGEKPRYFILDNIDPARINRTIDIVYPDRDKTLLIVISKSGETPETLSQFMIFKDIIDGGGTGTERIILITDRERGILNEIAKKEGYRTLHVPDGVGGRFSVLTPVGLFPSMVMGLDVEGILDGAQDMAIHIREKGPEENIAQLLAAVLFIMDRNGKKIHVMMPYSERLSSFADWFRQLEGESLGKEGKGPTPLKAIGVTDQHSQLQLYIDGPKDKLIIFLYGEDEDRAIPNAFPYVESLDYLAGRGLKELFYGEMLGTALSLTEAGTPNITIRTEKIKGYTLGALFYLFEMVITYLGYLYKINPFDQPGVELGKIYTKAFMGKKGMDKERAKVEKHLSTPKETVTF
ncbi:MAG: hypothetical protein N2745_01240 [Syntrophorhabdaceae bacterium]|nr:hypothetical protein [Syntrophorhabdaceae bacterium]